MGSSANACTSVPAGATSFTYDADGNRATTLYPGSVTMTQLSRWRVVVSSGCPEPPDRAPAPKVRVVGRPSLLKTACAIAASVTSVLTAVAPAAAAPAPLALGFNDPVSFQGGLSPSERALAFAHAREVGATTIRLGLSWRYADTGRPPSRAAARDPNWPGYNWGEIDEEVRAVVDAGLQPIVVVSIAPEWFEGPSRPSTNVAPAGTWRPDPTALGDFAYALAARFDGRTRDSAGALLPRVRYLQGWNEPNLPEYLTPQSAPRGHGRVPVSPGLYRSLINSFYSAVKSVRKDDFVLNAGIAPYGDYPELTVRGRTPPLYFIRSLLCVKGSKAHHCPRIYYDAFATHAFPQIDPRRKPLNKDDVLLRVSGVTRLLRLAAKAGTISSAQARRLWETEVVWNGDPPGVGSQTYEQQALYLQLALYMLWREGVDNVIWFNMRDRHAECCFTFGGLYAYSPTVEGDRPKPALTGYRFPFVAVRSGRRTLVWGRAPTAGTSVTIEKADGRGGWRKLATVKVGAGHVFTRRVGGTGHAQLRARQGPDMSLPSAAMTVRT